MRKAREAGIRASRISAGRRPVAREKLADPRAVPHRMLKPVAATAVRFGIVLLPESLAGFGGLCREVEESGFDWLGVADSLDHDERAHRSAG